jgi:cytochrome oxidase Cu insertion factor (SCO1/SenC/PrrC family)
MRALQGLLVLFLCLPPAPAQDKPGKQGKAPASTAARPAIGRPAPEIEGEDLDGNPFKLSDYRGKVVVLDFWGNW